MLENSGKSSPSKVSCRCNMRSILTFIVSILAVIQWCLISLLLSERQSLIMKIDEITNDQDRNIPAVKMSDQIETVENTPSNISSENYDSIKYEGVAVTIMLNSPKWFQRRYSTMISNILINTPPSWALQIFYTNEGQSQSGIDLNPGISKLNQTYERLIFTELPHELLQQYGTKRKLSYMTNKWVWERMVADRVLVFSGNSGLCSNSNLSLLDGSIRNQLFDKVDYVGSPWRQMFGEGGEGTISYRNRTAMIDAIIYRGPNTSKQREDEYFISALKDMNKRIGFSKYRVATKEQTIMFAGIDEFEEENGPPFAIFGTAAKLEHDKRELLLSLCPEIKIIFPSLHNPHCFGAHPDGEKCASTICALKEKKDRPSGC